jgi:hypothetical protein
MRPLHLLMRSWSGGVHEFAVDDALKTTILVQSMGCKTGQRGRTVLPWYTSSFETLGGPKAGSVYRNSRLCRSSLALIAKAKLRETKLVDLYQGPCAGAAYDDQSVM